MTKWSYSRVGCYNQCPYRYKLRYLDKLRTLPDQAANNALYLGSGLHKGIETTVEQGVAEYLGHYYVLTDDIINWSLQLEYWIPKVKALLPSHGKHEVGISDDNFIGYADYVCRDSIYDFKFTNNVDSYLTSPQLSLYKYFLEKKNPNRKFNHLYFVFIPKVQIRKKKTETIQLFRQRLYRELETLEVKVVEVPYDESSVTFFLEDCKRIETIADYPKNLTRLCDWCEYCEYCLNGEETDLELPSAQRRKPGSITQRRIWLYGRPFTGKTTFADAAPNPLMLNTDGNVSYVTAPFIPIKDEVTVTGRLTKRKFAWEVFKEAIDELEKGNNEFKTIVVDLLDDTYEMCRLYMYDKLHITHESDDSFKAWDKVRTEYLSTIRRLMTLPYENIILISHEDSTKDITKKSGENLTSIKPNIADKCANKIAGMVGLVGRVVADDGKRSIQFKTDDVVFGGGRLNIAETEIPLEWDALVRLFDEANANAEKKYATNKK
jgi:phage nucleotide-binding protein